MRNSSCASSTNPTPRLPSPCSRTRRGFESNTLHVRRGPTAEYRCASRAAPVDRQPCAALRSDVHRAAPRCSLSSLRSSECSVNCSTQRGSPPLLSADDHRALLPFSDRFRRATLRRTACDGAPRCAALFAAPPPAARLQGVLLRQDPSPMALAAHRIEEHATRRSRADPVRRSGALSVAADQVPADPVAAPGIVRQLHSANGWSHLSC